MTPQTRTSLKELQNLDEEITALRSETQSFEPLLEEVDEPVLRLEQGVQALEKRLHRDQARGEQNRADDRREEGPGGQAARTHGGGPERAGRGGCAC